MCHLVARPHCRVCVGHSRAGRLRALNAGSPHSHVDVAQETLWSEFDQHLTTASPRAAQWACGSSQLGSDQQSSQLHLHKVPKRSSLVVRRPRDTLVRVDQHPRRRLPGPRNGLVGHRRRRSTNIPNCYPQVTRAVALIDLNAGAARLKHLSYFSIGTADLVELELLHWEREERRPCLL